MSREEVLIQFPGALSLNQLEQRVARILSERNIVPENTLLSISSCSDEIEERLERVFDKKWNRKSCFATL